MKVLQNTVPRESLCYSCRHSHILRGFAESEEVVYCDFGYPTRLVPFPVRECTSYGNKNESRLDDMEDIALIVQPTKRVAAESPGFFNPKSAPRDGDAK